MSLCDEKQFDRSPGCILYAGHNGMHVGPDGTTWWGKVEEDEDGD